VYAGQVYFLASAEAKKAFDADPEKYLPRYGGLCTTILSTEGGARVAGDPQIFEIFKGKVYFFSQERGRDSFLAQGGDSVIIRADKHFNPPDLDGYCPVSYQVRDRAVKGGPKYKVIYRKKVYHLSGPEAKQAFLKAPQRYLPQYRGFCALGVSSNKLYSGSPAVFSVVGGKTYLFWNAEAKRVFDANPTALSKRADGNWAKLKWQSAASGQ
jgi:YHS domain-containing protein